MSTTFVRYNSGRLRECPYCARQKISVPLRFDEAGLSRCKLCERDYSLR